jgi:hypothetical protein
MRCGLLRIWRVVFGEADAFLVDIGFDRLAVAVRRRGLHDHLGRAAGVARGRSRLLIVWQHQCDHHQNSERGMLLSGNGLVSSRLYTKWPGKPSRPVYQALISTLSSKPSEVGYYLGFHV